MSRTARSICVALSILPTLGCATKVVTFKTTGPAKVSVLNSGKLDSPADPIGDTPLTLDLDQLEGKVVRITQPGALPVYWVVAEAAGSSTDANIAFIPDPTAATASGPDGRVDAKTSANRVLRLLLKSYQALSGKRFQTARELAGQAATINPEIAAPQVILGLSYFQEGKTADAKAALQKARALDPEDRDIDELLKVVER